MNHKHRRYAAAAVPGADAFGQRRQLRLHPSFINAGFFSHSPAWRQASQRVCGSSQPSCCSSAADSGLSTAGLSTSLSTAGVSTRPLGALLARGEVVRSWLATAMVARGWLLTTDVTPPCGTTAPSLHSLQLALQNWCMNCGFLRHWLSAAHAEHSGLRSTQRDVTAACVEECTSSSGPVAAGKTSILSSSAVAASARSSKGHAAEADLRAGQQLDVGRIISLSRGALRLTIIEGRQEGGRRCSVPVAVAVASRDETPSTATERALFEARQRRMRPRRQGE